MHREHGVDARDLENSEHAWVRDDDGEPASCVGELATGACEYAHPRGVEERALGEVDHGRIGGHGREGLLQARHRCQVELPGDTEHDRSPGHHLGLDVKLVRHAHRARV